VAHLLEQGLQYKVPAASTSIVSLGHVQVPSEFCSSKPAAQSKHRSAPPAIPQRAHPYPHFTHDPEDS